MGWINLCEFACNPLWLYVLILIFISSLSSIDHRVQPFRYIKYKNLSLHFYKHSLTNLHCQCYIFKWLIQKVYINKNASSWASRLFSVFFHWQFAWLSDLFIHSCKLRVLLCTKAGRVESVLHLSTYKWHLPSVLKDNLWFSFTCGSSLYCQKHLNFFKWKI